MVEQPTCQGFWYFNLCNLIHCWFVGGRAWFCYKSSPASARGIIFYRKGIEVNKTKKIGALSHTFIQNAKQFHNSTLLSIFRQSVGHSTCSAKVLIPSSTQSVWHPIHKIKTPSLRSELDLRNASLLSDASQEKLLKAACACVRACVREVTGTLNHLSQLLWCYSLQKNRKLFRLGRLSHHNLTHPAR